MNAPLRGVPLTPLSARNARGVRGAAKKIMKKYEKTLDNAADVIHGNWLFADSQLTQSRFA
jgi:hypothetical protein